MTEAETGENYYQLDQQSKWFRQSASSSKGHLTLDTYIHVIVRKGFFVDAPDSMPDLHVMYKSSK